MIKECLISRVVSYKKFLDLKSKNIVPDDLKKFRHVDMHNNIYFQTIIENSSFQIENMIFHINNLLYQFHFISFENNVLRFAQTTVYFDQNNVRKIKSIRYVDIYV